MDRRKPTVLCPFYILFPSLPFPLSHSLLRIQPFPIPVPPASAMSLPSPASPSLFHEISHVSPPLSISYFSPLLILQHISPDPNPVLAGRRVTRAAAPFDPRPPHDPARARTRNRVAVPDACTLRTWILVALVLHAVPGREEDDGEGRGDEAGERKRGLVFKTGRRAMTM